MDFGKIIGIAALIFVGGRVLQARTQAQATTMPTTVAPTNGIISGGGGGGDVGKTGGSDQTLLVNWLFPYDPYTMDIVGDEPSTYRQQYPYKPGVISLEN